VLVAASYVLRLAELNDIVRLAALRLRRVLPGR